ncbi:MAG TPA: tail fiber domain-containing protein [Pyrinomonadaceae bacterium]|jgi:hypothetical protein
MSTPNTSRPAGGPFRANNPLDFVLYDQQDKQEVIYITDHPQGREMHFEVSNASAETVKLAAPADAAPVGPRSHHFELRFRAGTLSAAALKGMKVVDADWALSAPTPEQAAGNGRGVSLYLRSARERTLRPGEKITLKLSGVSADQGVGARVTRVELKFRPTPGEANLLAGPRLQHLSVVNHNGQKAIPLHVGFYGSNTVLNDGTSMNLLRLRLTNVANAPLALTPDLPGRVGSKFVISFDVQQEDPQRAVTEPWKDWALGTASQVAKIDIATTPDWKIEKHDQGLAPEWVLTTQTKTSLSPGEAVELTLGEVKDGVLTGGIVSSLPSGPTSVYVRYENVPGHWDGQLVATIEKAPAVFRDDRVGVGTADPKARLDVMGAANVWAGDRYAVPNRRMAPGSLTIGSTSSNYGGGTNFWNDNTAGLLLEAQDNTEIAVHDSNRRVASLMYYEGGDVNRLTVGRNMGWDALRTLALNGNVGIGTPTPGFALQVGSVDAVGSAKLCVAGRGPTGNWRQWTLRTGDGANTADIHKLRIRDEQANADRIIIDQNGNVGIGTNAPDESKLKVANSAADFAHYRFISAGGELEFVAWDFGWNINTKTAGKSLFLNRDTSADVLIGPFGKELTVKGNSGNVSISGNVGVRTNDPQRAFDLFSDNSDYGMLRINRNSATAGETSIGFFDTNTRTGNTAWVAGVGGWGNTGDFVIGNENGGQGGNVRLLIERGGNVGIGTSDPKAPLHVGFAHRAEHWVKDQFTILNYTWNAHKSNDYYCGLSDRGQPQYFDDTSICAEGRVVGTEFNAFSDSRIKKNVRTSQSPDDLRLLQQLRVTDYQFKDFLAHGNRDSKGFIAEEVEQFFPQAVSKRSDFIPDIYAFAEETMLNDNVLNVTLTAAHNLVAGDVVRLITEADGVKEVSVSVVDERTFAVADWKGPAGKLFVHGRKVDDLRTLDYQQIFALGVSGLQQLAREVAELKAANAVLAARLRLKGGGPANARRVGRQAAGS